MSCLECGSFADWPKWTCKKCDEKYIQLWEKDNEYTSSIPHWKENEMKAKILDDAFEEAFSEKDEDI